MGINAINVYFGALNNALNWLFLYMVILNEKIDTLRGLSQLFSTSQFEKIVRNNDRKYIQKKISKHFSDNKTYKKILSFLYSELKDKYRNEYLYKNALLNELLLKKYRLTTTTVLNEFTIGSSIADFILLNGEARIYEIKTDLDSLDKLDKQLNDYIQFANKVYVVTSSKHVNKLLTKYDNTTIGIIEFTDRNTFKEHRAAANNARYFSHTTIFKTLRKDEYLDVVKTEFGFVPDVPNTLIFRECLEMIKTLDVSYFQVLAFNKLKKRNIKCPELLVDEKTPYELKHICYTLNLNEDEYADFYNFLNTKV